MRDNHLSFAKVLQKKKQASMKQLKFSTLKGLLMQYQDNPDANYTIYLGKRDMEDKRRQKRNLKEKEFDGNEEVFDCWLEKQAFYKSNKENHSFQQKTKSKRQQYGNIQQITFSPTCKDNKLRNRQLVQKQQRNNSLRQFNLTHIDINEQKSSKLTLEIENQHTQKESLPNIADKSTKNQQCRTKLMYQTASNEVYNLNCLKNDQQQKQIRNNSKIEQLIVGTQTIYKQIAQLAKSLINQNPNLFQEKINQYCSNNSHQAIEKQQPLHSTIIQEDILHSQSEANLSKKRFQQAKHQLQGYLDKFMKNKSKQTDKQSIRGHPTSPIQCNMIVGFSFSPEINFTNQQSSKNQLYVNQIYEAKSQIPSEIINDTKFNELKKNFPCLSTLKIENQNIMDIQSVQFHSDTITPQNRISDNIPQTSKEAKLMPITQNEDYQKQRKKGTFMEIEEIIQMKKVVKRDQYCQNKQKGSPFSTKVYHQQKPPNQKLSLISHNKLKHNTIHTNKTSPKLTLQASKQPKTEITQFASSQSPKKEQNNILSSNQRNKVTIKSIRDVKYSIINPIVLHPSNMNLVKGLQDNGTSDNKNNSKVLQIRESHKNSHLNVRFNYQNRENSSIQSFFHKKQEKQIASCTILKQSQNMNKRVKQSQIIRQNEIPNFLKPLNCTQSSESSEFIFDI